jgi:serine/threonine protein kinase/tetratricopeptide (TPR) repeat protein
MSLSPGTRIGPYEVISIIGAGGMGEVYRARDPRLDRDVALKVLPGEFSADADRLRRLALEARAAAALNHPNIVTIHSVEEANGTHFLTMEFIDGSPLSGAISKSGLPLEQFLTIAVPLADAISAAHQRGITHRDLKPANIMVTADGRVKVLDFGLAKLRERQSEPVPASALTTMDAAEQTTVRGTLAYMSPEQAEGKPVDQRSDIFSLGVVFYEMATGQRPFTGDTTFSLLSAIVKDTPRDVADVNPSLPHELSRIIERCLVKDPEYRWQSAKDLRNELQALHRERASPMRTKRGTRRSVRRIAIATAVLLAAVTALDRYWFSRRPGGGAFDSLAVLPFVNVGADQNTEYLSDGITENLINSFSQLPKLRVVPRSRAFHYKGRDVEPETIGRELGVVAVLTGRVLQRGDELNIQVELVDVGRDSQLWGRQYKGTLSEIITVQEAIAKEVAERLGLRPTAAEQQRLTKRYTSVPEAHELYLKGRYLWNRRTRETVQRAAQYFQEALDKDPGYALAWAGLADCYGVYSVYGVLSSKESVPRAKEAATKALEADDTLAEAHASLGYADSYAWDWSGADREFRRAIELDPSYPTAHHWRGTNFLEVMGRLNDAMTELRRAQELDPLSLVIAAVVARDLIFARQYDRAEVELRKALEMDSRFALAHAYLGLAYEQQGRIEQAVAQFHEWQTLSGDEPAATAALGHAYAMSGRRTDAQKALFRLQDLAKDRYVAPYDIAVVYLGLGDKAKAMDWLDRAYDDHSAWLIWVKLDPRFDGIRPAPHYHDLLRGMKIPD